MTERSKSGNPIIPNSFQHPNVYVDWLSYYLTPQEEVVLNKAIREILGWYNKIEDRKARISLSVFTDGKKREGEILCLGCGLSTGAIRKALKALDEFGILIKIGEPSKRDGQLFYLQDDPDQIDWDALKARDEQKKARGRKRTSKARATKQEDKSLLSDNTPQEPPIETVVPLHKDCSPTTQKGYVPQQQRNPLETQVETQEDFAQESERGNGGDPSPEPSALDEFFGPAPEKKPLQVGRWEDRYQEGDPDPWINWSRGGVLPQERDLG